MEWIAPTIAGLLGLLGIGKLIEMAYNAKLERKKTQELLHKSASEKEIDADINAFDAIHARLALVETKLDKVNDQLTDQKVENAKLEAENVRLTKDADRQDIELERQRMRVHKLSEHITGKDAQILEMQAALRRSNDVIATLRSELNATRLEVHELARQLKGRTVNDVIATDEVVNVKLVEEE